MRIIKIRQLTLDNFRPYGWLLNQSIPPAFHDANTDFSHQHIFDPGFGGETEILRVNYRNTFREIRTLEAHVLTQQAIIPLTGEIIHVVACNGSNGLPDMGTVSAFRIRTGQAVCMSTGCWHTTRVEVPEVQCLMLTRRSTTIDLADHLNVGSPLLETNWASLRGELDHLLAGEPGS